VRAVPGADQLYTCWPREEGWGWGREALWGDFLRLVRDVELGDAERLQLDLDLLDLVVDVRLVAPLLLLLLELLDHAVALLLVVREQQPREHLDEGGLARAVLPEHHNDLRVLELAGRDLQPELGASLLLHERLYHLQVEKDGSMATPPPSSY